MKKVNISILILFVAVCIILAVHYKREGFSDGDVNRGYKEADPGLLVLQDFTKYGVKGEKGDLGKDLIERSGRLSLGGWDSGSSGTDEDGQVQLLISGKHNSGANNPNNNWTTFKLKIEGYNNDGPTVYPIFCQDENKNIDLYLKNRTKNSKSVLYIGGDLRVNNNVQINGNLNFSQDSKINHISVSSNANINGNVGVGGTLTVAGYNFMHHIVPKGTIIAFYRNSGFPHGWVKCDGRIAWGLRTPDLRGRFILHEKPGRTFGSRGGAEYVRLGVEHMPSHNHSMNSTGHHNHTGNTNATGNHNHRIGVLNRQGNPDGWRDGGRHYWRNSNYYLNRTQDQGKMTDHAGNHNHSFTTNTRGGHAHNISNTGGNRPHENMPPYYVLVYIIKCI